MKNIASEKLKLIEWIVELEDIIILKNLIELKEEAEFYKEFPVMTKEQLIKNALASEEDIKFGRVYDIKTVELENWD